MLAVLLGFLLFSIISFSIILGYQLKYLGRIYPGISISGLDVSGLKTDEAYLTLLQKMDYPQNGRILLYDELSWLATPSELGLSMDPDSMVSNAYQIGRSGNLFKRIEAQYSARLSHNSLSTIYIYNQQTAYQYLSEIAKQINQPVIEPSIQINGIQVEILPGQTGRELDVLSSMQLINKQIKTSQDVAIPLIVHEEHPILIDLSAQAELASTILSQPLIIHLPNSETDGTTSWTFEPETLSSMLSFEFVKANGSAEYKVTLDTIILQDFLTQLAPSLQIQEENPRFIFNDETGELELLEPMLIGRTLDINTSLQNIQQKLVEGKHQIPLELIYTLPPVSDEDTGEKIGVTELVHQEISYYYGSSEARIQNIQAAASRFHGLLIAPGETFSMVDALGDISLDSGYAEALIIYGDQTIKGVGGGVCQVSTTLFRTAFFSGFPIIERYSHAYRVSYYEKKADNSRDASLAGLDATVYTPIVDFKFENDTPHWLLMETYVNPTYRTLVWKFYSTSDNRIVEWETTGPIHIVEAPKPIYRENDELEENEVKQIDWEADGADVTVNRTVWKEEEIHLQDTFFTHYEPWQAIYEYAPGTEGMPPEDNEEEDESN